eukprot:m.133163 g.133163  ORF g.133163 m.133163 type:complete len:82 (+) comp38111_c0_seq4:474-719(+)
MPLGGAPPARKLMCRFRRLKTSDFQRTLPKSLEQSPAFTLYRNLQEGRIFAKKYVFFLYRQLHISEISRPRSFFVLGIEEY